MTILGFYHDNKVSPVQGRDLERVLSPLAGNELIPTLPFGGKGLSELVTFGNHAVKINEIYSSKLAFETTTTVIPSQRERVRVRENGYAGRNK